MPLHDYLCEACGHRQEELIRHDADEEGLACAACGSPRLSRQISAPSPAPGSCSSDAASGFG
jgi:putative FmdB family regulatory protein